MNGRETGLCVISALTVASLAGVAGAALMARGKAPSGAVVFVLGPSVAVGAWAMILWAWWLSGGVVS